MSFLLSQMRSRAAMQSSSLAYRTFTTTAPRSVAKISLIGRLGSEIELKTSQSGIEYLTYSLGTSTGLRDASGNRITSWFRIANFNTPAEGSKGREYLLGLEKGTLLYVEGDVSMNTYTDKDSGKNHNSLNIVQRNLEVLKRNASGSYQGGSSEFEDSTAAGGQP